MITSSEAIYVKGSDLADLQITWKDSSGQPVDLSVGHTFEAKVGIPGQAAEFTKATGITGTTTGCTIAWATVGELNTLDTGFHTLQITATRTADSKQRIQQLRLRIVDAIT